MDEKKIEYLDVNSLVFDPDNPRLPQTLRDKKNDADYESSIIDWMLQFENVTELMGSIGEKGFFAAEPILVVPNGSGKYEVVEGNRRLTAVKLLNEPSLASKKKKAIEEILSEVRTDINLSSIPSIKFDKREEVLAYLGYKHITGVQPWDSLAKAKYLKQLLETIPDGSLNDKCRVLAKIIGSKANYVRLLLVGVDVFSRIEENNFYDIPALGEENFEFGVFYTALQKGNIASYVGIDFESDEPIQNLIDENLEDLTQWVFERNSEGFTRLGESRNLPKLNKILDEKFPKALVAFKEGGKTLDESARLTDHPLEVFQKSLNDSLSSLRVSRDYSHEIDRPTNSQLDTLKEIYSMSRDLYKLVQSKMIDLDDLEL